MKRRSQIILILSVLLIISIGISALYIFVFPITSLPEGTGMNNALEINLPVMRNTGIRVSAQGNVFTLKNGILKEISKRRTQIISTMVFEAIPSEQGVFYISGRTLYYAGQESVITIAEDVDTFAWNGTQVVYCSMGFLVRWENGETQTLAMVPEMNMYKLVATKDRVVIVEDSFLLQYTEKKGLEKIDFRIDETESLFLYKNKVILVTGGKSEAIVLDLDDRETQYFDIGWDACEHDNEIAVACDNKYIYLSVQSQPWPFFDEEQKNTTLCIDPETWSAKSISSEFYDALFCSSNTIYGLKTYLHRNQWVIVAEISSAKNSFS